MFETPFDPFFNVGFDEALLTSVLERRTDYPVLRIWRNDKSVILGALSSISSEVNMECIERNHIPLIRRITGGGTVYHDLGNINYTIVIDKGLHDRSSLIGVDYLYDRLLKGVIKALRNLGIDNIRIANRSDIVVKGYKVSGNASTMKKNVYLLHGTLLVDADLKLLGECLIIPPRNVRKNIDMVKYRVANLRDLYNNYLSYDKIIDSIIKGFSELLDRQPLYDIPSRLELEETRQLVAMKYKREDWIYRRR